MIKPGEFQYMAAGSGVQHSEFNPSRTEATRLVHGREGKPGPRTDAEIGVHGLAFYGNVLFSLGPNTELGGSNDTACHMDMPLRNCNLYLDGAPIVERGQVVPAEMRAPGY